MSYIKLTMKPLRGGRFQPQKNGKPFGESGSREKILQQFYDLVTGSDVVAIERDTSRSPKRRKKP